MKVIIPVAGAGTRLRPHTYTQPKPLIPVAGKTILATIIDQLLEVEKLEQIILVIGYLGDKIREYVEKTYPDAPIEFVYQEQRLGLGHAIWSAKAQVEQDKELFIALGDIIFDCDLNLMINSPNSCLAIKKVEDPRNFGVAELNEQGQVRRLVEKPKIPKSNLALIGLYKINEVSLLFECLEYIIQQDLRTRNEYQLTDALMLMIEKGANFNTLQVDVWHDCGRKEILLETNALLLKRASYKNNPPQQFPHTIVIPPVFIGQNCQIQNSIIGPNVSIGDNSSLKNTIIRNSIIGNFAAIEDTVLNKSLIGNDAAIKGVCQSLNIGDNTQIDFSV